MFRHQKPLAADFLGLEKVVATNRFRQTGKNLMMIDSLQQLIDDELKDRVSTYGHRGLQKMAGMLIVPSAYSEAFEASRKHFDHTHGYVSKRVGQKAPERVYDETYNPIMQAVMGLIDHIEIRSTGDWRKDWYLQAFKNVEIMRPCNVGKSMPLDALLRDHRNALSMWVPRPYQEPLITEIGYRLTDAHSGMGMVCRDPKLH